jgi:signal transduction histidine kinase
VQLGTRLLLVGALLPALLLGAALVAGGIALDRILHASVDQALLSQAAVEAVSLFDRAGAPHLHLIDSPLDSSVREFAPRGALYDPQGRIITRYPEGADVPATVEPASLDLQPTLSTAVVDGVPHRVVGMRVLATDGSAHGLWLAASLENHDAAVRAYWQVTGGAVLVVMLILITIQTTHARRLHRRITVLGDHMERLRAGDYARAPPPDPARDVLGGLRDAIAITTTKLAAAREAQDRLLADAAHELRTPLTAMRAGIDVALRRPRGVDELERVLAGLREEVDRLAALASRLLDMAALRAAPLDRVPGDVAKLVADAVDAALGLAEERGVVLEIVGAPRASAEFAPSVLRQAIDNLVDNAIKYSPAGGRVTLTVEVVPGLVRVRVADRGLGVPVEQRERIFEPFERRDRAARGKGLGLAIVREVAERHGGRVWVESGPDGGAVFVLELPDATGVDR